MESRNSHSAVLIVVSYRKHSALVTKLDALTQGVGTSGLQTSPSVAFGDTSPWMGRNGGRLGAGVAVL